MLFLLLGVSSARASDHNNLEKDRPLRFEDAYPIAYRAMELQNGLRLDFRRGKSPIYNFRSEFQVGFAKNKDLTIGFDPYFSSNNRGLVGNTAEVSYFEGVTREIRSNPAFGYRITGELPLSGGSSFELQARGILTKSLRGRDKIHLNLDLSRASRGPVRLGAIVGFSAPVGFPKRFDETFLVEVGMEQRQGVSGGSAWVGAGLRRQLSATGVLDIGVQAGDSRHLTLGYSLSF